MELSAAGFVVGSALKSGAEYIRTQLQKIDPDNIEQLERASTLLNCYRYGVNIFSGARAGLIVGSAVGSLPGSVGGMILGGASGIAKSYTEDQLSDAAIELSSSALRSSYPNLTKDDADLLSSAAFIAHGGKGLVRDLAIKVQSAGRNVGKSLKNVVAYKDDLSYACGSGVSKFDFSDSTKKDSSSLFFKKSMDDTSVGLKSKDYGVDVSKPAVVKDYNHLGGEVISLDRDAMKARGLVDAYKKSFPDEVNWTAPVGTKQTYKVHQRNDINWDHVRVNSDGPYDFVGKTNREAALFGKAPELSDGNFVTIHHVGQNALGPLVETSTKLHSFKNKEAFKILHNQFPGRKHPDFPVNHSIWGREVPEYWKERMKNAR